LCKAVEINRRCIWGFEKVDLILTIGSNCCIVLSEYKT
jgi:hypothetical protein